MGNETAKRVGLVVAGAITLFILLIGAVLFLAQSGSDTSAAGAEGSLAGNFDMVDDYPFKSAPYNAMNPQSHYAYGNCTDFVWWRINRDAGITKAPWKLTWSDLTPHGGNGKQWGLPGNLPGWNTTRTPVPGDVISISTPGILGAMDPVAGHVGYVGAVDDSGGVTIENYGHNRYFITHTTISELGHYIDSGSVVVKHNPRGRAAGPQGSIDANGNAQAAAKTLLADDTQFACLLTLWKNESGWNPTAKNPSSGAYGIPQALPAKKMQSVGSDWRTNPITQVKWGLQYIKSAYGTPCNAWNQWQSRSPHWY